MMRTVRCPIEFDAALLETVRIGCDVFSFYAKMGYDANCYSKLKLHRLAYAKAREAFPGYPSQLTLNIGGTVAEARRSARSNGECNKLVTPGKNRALRYDARCFKLNVLTGRGSLASINGRRNFQVRLPTWCMDGWNCKAATLVVKKGDRIYLHAVMEKPDPPKLLFTEKDMLGGDRGIKNILVTSDNKFYNSKHLRAVKARYQHLKSELQSKGTRSAKRKYYAVSGKERRFVTDVNHCLSKRLVESEFIVFVLEDLTGIRKRTGEKGKGRKKQRKSIGSWSFHQFGLFLAYKAEAAGKMVLAVDPRHTSQECSCCGHTEKANRNGSRFVCLKCGFSLNADLNASRNILHRGISSLQRLNSKPAECSLQR
jgi:IS605 OrfB family transposase